MAQQSRRLTDIKIKALKEAGLYPDGAGLYLKITTTGTKSWIYRFKYNSRLRDMGLGKYPAVSLSTARERASENYTLIKRGIDPIDAREVQASANKAKVHVVTFAEAAQRCVASHEGNWRNPKHRQQWRTTIKQYALPVIGEMNVADITTDDVLRILEPIWRDRAETASRVRGRIENILDWAAARKLRHGENPARWRGHLAHLLPARNKTHSVQHFPAMPWGEVPAFLADLRTLTDIASKALEFTILTAARTNMALGAEWGEFDLDARLWRVPKERMKSGIEFHAPLSAAAIALLMDLHQFEGNPYVFPGWRPLRPMADRMMHKRLTGMRPGLTVHGFRSSFRDWVADATTFAGDLAEMCLAHNVAGAVEAAYRRSEMIEKRRKIMDAWASFCARGKQDGKVVPITQRLAGQGR